MMGYIHSVSPLVAGDEGGKGGGVNTKDPDPVTLRNFCSKVNTRDNYCLVSASEINY